MFMKKGQATTFMILGLVILATVVLLFFLRGQFLFGPITVDKIQDKAMGPIMDHIGDCVNEVAPDYFERIGLQGGYLKTPKDTYKLYDGVSVSYLCYNMENVPVCYSRYLTVGDMENQLENAIMEGLGTCINIKKLAKGLDLNLGKLNVDVDVGDYSSIINLNFPIRLGRGDVYVEEDNFETVLDVPLGALHGVAMDIVEVETQVGEFEQLIYMLSHKGQCVIDKKKPYPDKMYILTSKDSDYIFQFFVQGEPGY